MECVDLPEIKPPPEKDQLECRLCEDFPVFNKNFDFHKHLADIHFRTQLNNDLPQVRDNPLERENVISFLFLLQGSPFKCPVDGCPYESKVRHNLTVHYGVTHRKVFKFYNAVVGAGSETDYMKHMTGSHAGRGGYRSRAGQGAANRRVAATMENCLVCEEQVSKETMVFHLAHKHFQDKVSHLPQTRPFKCPECPHINEFQVKFSSRLRLFFY